MGRNPTVSDVDVLNRLSQVFRDVGYQGATLSMLEQASGLKKASLYHRFPRGKEQMAAEVLAFAGRWVSENVLAVLQGPGKPRARVSRVTRSLKEFYAGGEKACLLNMLAPTQVLGELFSDTIRQMFEAWIEALATVARDAGVSSRQARARAERVVMLMQGSLVMSRGMGTTRPFELFVKSIPHELGLTNA